MQWRQFVAALAVFTGALFVHAAEMDGTFKSFDKEKKVLTVRVGEKDADFVIPDDAKITTPKGEAAKEGIKIFSSTRIAKTGAPLTIVTTSKNGKETVTEIRLGKRKNR